MYATTTNFTAYDTVFDENTASDAAESFGEAGGFGVVDGNVSLANVIISSNLAYGEDYCSDGGFAVTNNSVTGTLDMANVVVAYNGCWLADSSTVFGSLIGSGGVGSAGNDVTMENVTIADNAVVYHGGSTPGTGLLVERGSLVMDNVAVVNNQGFGTGGSAIRVAGLGSTSVTYTDVYGNDGSAYSGMTDPTGTDGNVSVEPGFVNETAGLSDMDFSLATGSALIDAGDPGILDADGSRSDVGAYGGPSGAW
jgi:hypothetical protein